MGMSKNSEFLIQSHPSGKPAYSKLERDHHSWMMMEHKDDQISMSPSSSSASSSFDSSSTSGASSDLQDDASSHQDSSPLYELSDLMTHLPIKRGLSKHYIGKSQSFTSLSKVMSVEDLAKKERFCRRKMKACKSIGAGLDHKLSPTSPKLAIFKKTSRNTQLSFVCHPTTRITYSSSFSQSPSPRPNGTASVDAD